jgi:hypothetical protein
MASKTQPNLAWKVLIFRDGTQYGSMGPYLGADGEQDARADARELLRDKSPGVTAKIVKTRWNPSRVIHQQPNPTLEDLDRWKDHPLLDTVILTDSEGYTRRLPKGEPVFVVGMTSDYRSYVAKRTTAGEAHAKRASETVWMDEWEARRVANDLNRRGGLRLTNSHLKVGEEAKLSSYGMETRARLGEEGLPSWRATVLEDMGSGYIVAPRGPLEPIADDMVVAADSTSRKWPGDNYEGVPPTGYLSPILNPRSSESAAFQAQEFLRALNREYAELRDLPRRSVVEQGRLRWLRGSILHWSKKLDRYREEMEGGLPNPTIYPSSSDPLGGVEVDWSHEVGDGRAVVKLLVSAENLARIHSSGGSTVSTDDIWSWYGYKNHFDESRLQFAPFLWAEVYQSDIDFGSSPPRWNPDWRALAEKAKQLAESAVSAGKEGATRIKEEAQVVAAKARIAKIQSELSSLEKCAKSLGNVHRPQLPDRYEVEEGRLVPGITEFHLMGGLKPGPKEGYEGLFEKREQLVDAETTLKQLQESVAKARQMRKK